MTLDIRDKTRYYIYMFNKRERCSGGTKMMFNKLFKASKALAVVAALGAVTFTSGCTTIGGALSASYDEIGGKVVRLRVYQYGLSYSETESADVARRRVDGMPWLLIYGGVKPSSEEILPYRWVYAVAPGGWDSTGLSGPQGWVQTLVADNVPLLHEGDWVDVYVPEAPLVVGKRRWLTVVKLVCKGDDKLCQAQDPVGKAKGQLVPGGSYRFETISITPHYDMNGNWLPGKKPARP